MISLIKNYSFDNSLISHPAISKYQGSVKPGISISPHKQIREINNSALPSYNSAFIGILSKLKFTEFFQGINPQACISARSKSFKNHLTSGPLLPVIIIKKGFLNDAEFDFKEVLFEEIKGNTSRLIAENPEIAIPGIKTAAQIGMRIVTLPIQTTLVQHIYKNLTPTNAWKHALKTPFAGTKAVVMSGGSDAFLFYSAKPVISNMLENHLSLSTKTSNLVAGFAAPIISTVATLPIDTIIMEKQLGKTRQNGLSPLYIGITPKIIRSVASWGVGLTIGSSLNDRIKPIVGDNLVGELASMSIGWTIGSFVGAPFHNIYVRMIDNNHRSMSDALKDMKISFKDPKSIIQNGPQLLKGFTKALPLIMLTGLTVGTVGHYARKNLETSRS